MKDKIKFAWNWLVDLFEVLAKVTLKSFIIYLIMRFIGEIFKEDILKDANFSFILMIVWFCDLISVSMDFSQIKK